MARFSVSSATVTEGSTITFTVTLDAVAAGTESVNYRFLTGNGLGTSNDGNVSWDGDPGQIFRLTFAPGETSKTVSAFIRSDSVDELDQSLTLELFDPANAELAGGGPALRAMGIVLDNDGTGSNLAVLVGSPIVYENDSGTQMARFEVRLSRAHTSALALSYATIDGSAQAGQDYFATSGTLNIAAGQVVGFVDVPVIGDTALENTETFFLKVTPPSAAPNAAGTVGIATILNDDATIDQPSISVSSYEVTEGDYLAFTVTLDQPSAGTVSVRYRLLTGNGLGTASDENTSWGGDPGEIFLLSFAPGETTKTISIYAPSDSRDEIDQSLTLELFDPSNAELAGGSPALRAMGIILDNDGVSSNLALLVGSPIVYENDSGTKMARFEVRLSQPHTAAVALSYTTLDGSAVAGQDYTAVTGTLTIVAGQIAGYVDVPVLGDTALENTETFFLQVTPPAAAPNATGSVGIATILNDDATIAQPVISVSSYAVTEGDYLAFTVTLDQPSAGTVSVRYRALTGNGLGTTNDENTSWNGDPGEIFRLTFAPGETTKTILLYAPSDSLDEIDQNLTLELFDPSNAELSGGVPALRAMGIILDDDGLGSNLAVLVGSPIVYENDSGTKMARFEVRLSQPHSTALALAYSTIDGSAYAGQDYTAVTGTLNFVAGQIAGYVDVPVLGDTALENTETFFLKVTAPTAAPSNAGTVGIATILNDDATIAQPAISVSSYAVTEGDYIAFTVTLDQPSVGTVAVRYRTLTGNGLGTAGDANTSWSGDTGEIYQPTFAPGETSKTISLYMPSDSVDEIDQSITLELFDPSNAELAGGGPVLRAMGIILDNDGPGSNLAVLVGSPLVYENDSGTRMARFEVRLSQPHNTALALAYNTIDGSAVAGQDYTAATGTLNFAAGQVSGFVDVPVLGDTALENTETFFLKVTPPTAAPSNAGSVGIATILNDDARLSQPAISVSSYATTEGDYLTFTVTLDQPSANAVSVRFRTLTGNGLGTASDINTSWSGDTGEIYQLAFAPGETTKTISIYAPSDSTDEIDQSVTIELFDPSNAELSGGGPALRAMGIILDDDGTGANLAVLVGSPILYENDSGTQMARFEVRLSQPHSAALALAFTTMDGSALAGQDYTAVSGTLNFAAGQVLAFVDVPVTGDTALENTETFFLKITPPTAAPSPLGTVGIATILNDDAVFNQPAISVNSYAGTEGDVMTFTVTLDQPAAGSVSVSYGLLSGPGYGTLSQAESFTTFNRTGILTFAPGETTKTLHFDTSSDSLDEIDESLTLVLFDPVNAELAGSAQSLFASGIVLDNDGVGNNIALAGVASTVHESLQPTSQTIFEIRLSQPFASQLQVNYSTVDGTALAGSDYVAATGVITFAPGQTVAYVPVTVLGDTIAESSENFSLMLTPTSLALGPANLSVQAIINDNDYSGSDLTGTALGDYLVGTAGNDLISGLGGNDTLIGNRGGDTLNPGTGNDLVDGGAGGDRAIFAATRGQSTVTRGAGSLTVSSALDGTDTLVRVEQLQFADGVFSFTFRNPGPAVIANFNPASGWTTQDQFPRHIADVNGDGFADVVGFGFSGVLVSFGSAGGSFSATRLVVSNFGQTAGWTSDNAFHRELADVNGDGRDDILGFGFAGTLVSLGNGNGTFQTAQTATANFGVAQGWANDTNFHRAVADVNGDGRDDIIGFGTAGTLVALANSNGTFATAQLVLNDFGVNQGWANNDAFPRIVTDVNGDDIADIVGFGTAGTLVAYGRGDGTFTSAGFDLANFGTAQGWSSSNTFYRDIADINNDGLADIIGFGIAGVLIANNQGDFLI